MTMDKEKVAVPFDRRALTLDVEAETEALCAWLQQSIGRDLKRRGAVLGLSGGVDSAVVAALCARALGHHRVLAVLMPEQESSPDSRAIAERLVAQLGVEAVVEDMTGSLAGAGSYQRRDEAIRRVFPSFGEGWKSKITLPGSLLEEDTLSVFYLTVVSPAGEEFRERIPPAEFMQIMAASNFKQRSRMAMLYYHAESRNYAVVGTANKNEHALGFFVKHGDGGVDLSPIGHLFKSQVYQLAAYLGIPEEIRERTPTSDTYSAGSTQEEFFFRLPFAVLDLIWAGLEQGAPAAEIAAALDLTVEQVERVMADIRRKQRTTEYLRTPPLTFAPAAA